MKKGRVDPNGLQISSLSGRSFLEFGSDDDIVKTSLRKEYNRYCKLYSSEPLDIVGGPLDKATLDEEQAFVDLKGRGLRGVDCIAISKMLASNMPISHLNLSDCLLLPQGFQALLDGLCKNTTLKILELRGNNIQNNMVPPLGALLKTNNTLKQLVLEWNSIGTSPEKFNEFTEGLALNHGIEKLDLRNNQISDDSTVDLACALKHNSVIKELDLRWNSAGVNGAKAIWDALQQENSSIVKLQLCGNFIPEEIASYIEHCLEKKKEREDIVQDYSKRTNKLTRQLQKTEEQYQAELSTMMEAFNTEENQLKKSLADREHRISELESRLTDEVRSSEALSSEVDKLKQMLSNCHEKEKTLLEAIEMKQEEQDGIQSTMKTGMDTLRATYETKIASIKEELNSSNLEKENLESKLEKLRGDLVEKNQQLNFLNERIQSMKKSIDELKAYYERKIEEEKERWSNWKSELETTEKKEINNMEQQITEMQSALTQHIKILEKGKSDAEEEVRRLKISFVTTKTEAEENAAKLRTAMREEHDKEVESIRNQLTTIQSKNDEYREQIDYQEGLTRKYENEITNLKRMNETLRAQVSHLNEEHKDKEVMLQASLARAKNDLREQFQLLAKEEEHNKNLRVKTLELQEQLATVTLKKNKEIQEITYEMEQCKLRVERREEELSRLKEEDMKRAGLLHEAFLAYMRSTSAATGIPLPVAFYDDENDEKPALPIATTPSQKGDGPPEEKCKDFRPTSRMINSSSVDKLKKQNLSSIKKKLSN